MRIRVTFSKTGPLIYIGNLDLYTIWERAARRAGLALAYSQGFHPQPKIHFAAPLPLGFSSRCELLDMRLNEECGLFRAGEPAAAGPARRNLDPRRREHRYAGSASAQRWYKRRSTRLHLRHRSTRRSSMTRVGALLAGLFDATRAPRATLRSAAADSSLSGLCKVRVNRHRRCSCDSKRRRAQPAGRTKCWRPWDLHAKMRGLSELPCIIGP